MLGSASRCTDRTRRSTSVWRVLFSPADSQSHRELFADSGDPWRTDQQPSGGGVVQGLAGLCQSAASCQPGQTEASGDQRRRQSTERFTRWARRCRQQAYQRERRQRTRQTQDRRNYHLLQTSRFLNPFSPAFF